MNDRCKKSSNYQLFSVTNIYRMYVTPEDLSWDSFTIKDHYETTIDPIKATYHDIHERNEKVPEEFFAYAVKRDLPDGQTIIDIYYNNVSKEIPVVTVISEQLI